MLLIQAADPHDSRAVLLPPGGGVEFGEKLDDAVKREILEEVGLLLTHVTAVGMLESVFQFAGQLEHELVFVYEAICNNEELAAKDEVVITESNGEILHARWYSPQEIADTKTPIFPEGLLDLLNTSDGG